MHKHIEDAGNALGIDLSHLEQAASFSEDTLTEVKTALGERVSVRDDCLDVVVFGSLARHEATGASDLDYVIAVHRLPDDVRRTRELIDAVTDAQRRIGFEDPGRTGMFGRVMSVADIAERIGLEQDTNANHSRRILLFQESVSIYADGLHERLLRALLKRYLDGYEEPKWGVPRFLLNDLVRYWRTIAVDYQAKQWESREPDWGLRYIKLITSRKLAFAGTLVSLLLTEVATVDYFVEQFQMPALARLAQIEPRLEAALKPKLGQILETANEFVRLLGDKDFRRDAKAVEAPFNVPPDSEFAKIRQRAKEMQEALEAVFFESDALGARTRKYLSF